MWHVLVRRRLPHGKGYVLLNVAVGSWETSLIDGYNVLLYKSIHLFMQLFILVIITTSPVITSVSSQVYLETRGRPTTTRPKPRTTFAVSLHRHSSSVSSSSSSSAKPSSSSWSSWLAKSSSDGYHKSGFTKNQMFAMTRSGSP